MLKQKKIFFIVTLFLLFSSLVAEDGLISNFSFSVIPSLDSNDLWVVCRGSKNNGISLMELVDSDRPSVEQFTSFEMEETAVNNNFIADLTGENRRVNSIQLKTQLVLAAFDTSAVETNTSNGLLVVAPNISDYLHLNLDLGEKEAETRAVTSFALVDDGATLLMSYGDAGLAKIKLDNGKIKPGLDVSFYRFNTDSESLDSISVCILDDSDMCSYSIILDNETSDAAKKYNAILSLKTDFDGQLLMGTTSGLWRVNSDLSVVNKLGEDLSQDARISGIWLSDSNVYVESSERIKEKNLTKSALYFSSDNANSFSKVYAMDDEGKKRMDLYDSLDVSLSGVAFVGDYAFAAINKIEGTLNGLLYLKGDSLLVNKKSENDIKYSEFAFGLEDGLSELDVRATDVQAFAPSGSNGAKWLAASTFGGGVSLSIDSGSTWNSIMNRSPVKGDLDQIRTIPSYLRFSNEESRIAYRLSKDAKVTIEVYSYDMYLVKTIVKNAYRSADPIRSSSATEDVWDGRDDNGSYVAVGLYYILVKDNKGHKGWGKIMWLGGR